MSRVDTPLPEPGTCTGTYTTAPPPPFTKAQPPSFSYTCPCSPDSQAPATLSPGRETPSSASAQQGAQPARGRLWVLWGLSICWAPSPSSPSSPSSTPAAGARSKRVSLRPRPATQPQSAFRSHHSLASQEPERGSPGTSPQGAHPSPSASRCLSVCLACLSRSVAHWEGECSPPHTLPVIQQRKNSAPAHPCPLHPITWTSAPQS